MDAMAAIAYGDLGSAILAVIAPVWLHYQWPGAIGVAWAVNIAHVQTWSCCPSGSVMPKRL